MTPETVIEKLKSIGYQIRTDGQDILLTSDHDPNNPELVTNLLKELRKCKAEAVNILKTGYNIKHSEIVKPVADIKAVWPPDTQALIDWFIKLEPPTEPFYLEPYIHVRDPEKFFVSLRREIEAGPSCPRGRNGALLYDLYTLRKILH